MLHINFLVYKPSSVHYIPFCLVVMSGSFNCVENPENFSMLEWVTLQCSNVWRLSVREEKFCYIINNISVNLRICR